MNGPAAAVIGIITARGRGGSDVAFGGLFPAQGRPDWPHGVQESDAPRFALDHAETLRPGATGEAGTNDIEDGPEGDIVDLFNRRLR